MNVTDGRTGRRAGPPRWVNRVVRAVLHSPLLHRLLDARLCELRYRTPRSGRTVALPVAYALDGDRVVVMVGNADRKRWWRAFRQPRPVSLLLRRRSRDGVGRIVDPSDPSYAHARLTYRLRHHVSSMDDAEFLVVE
jgi:hypothetical protein